MNEFGIAIKKGLIYALCFWVVYKVLNALWSVGTPSSDENMRTAQDEYVRQQKKTSELIIESERQHKRMEAVISLQDENARHFKSVLTQMEKSFKSDVNTKK
jgi:K+/H+ antiporter YhaU regulatory subunit KhtT